MGADVVEVVVGNELSHQRVVGEAETLAAALSHRCLAEVGLIAKPSCRTSVAYTGIDLEVKPLFCGIVAHMGRGETVESVNDEHRLLSLWHIEGRHHL